MGGNALGPFHKDLIHLISSETCNKMVNNQQFLGSWERLLGIYGALWGRLAGVWKPHTPHKVHVFFMMIKLKELLTAAKNSPADDSFTQAGEVLLRSLNLRTHVPVLILSLCLFVFSYNQLTQWHIDPIILSFCLQHCEPHICVPTVRSPALRK